MTARRGVLDPDAGLRVVEPGGRVRGTIRPPGDKSISHRALLFGALATGTTRVEGLSPGGDVATTEALLRQLGVDIEGSGTERTIQGLGGRFNEPGDVLDCGNAGTAMRLLLGALAPSPGLFVLTGDESLRRRPMARVIAPLTAMGARVDGRLGGTAAPIVLRGGALRAVPWRCEQSSAQVKGAVLLAGLGARGRTVVTEPHPSRDHSERLLRLFSAPVEPVEGGVAIEGPATLRAPASPLVVPGDPSSAAFFVAAAAMVPGSSLRVEGLSLNPGRTGFFSVLSEMGAQLEIEANTEAEPWGVLSVEAGDLRAATINGARVPTLIDELPLLAVVAARARGTTRVRGAAELRTKESDRLDAIGRLLTTLGVEHRIEPDGFDVVGQPGRPFPAARFEGGGDHRLAMAAAIAALASDGPIQIGGCSAIDTSFPDFFEHLEALRHG